MISQTAKIVCKLIGASCVFVGELVARRSRYAETLEPDHGNVSVRLYRQVLRMRHSCLSRDAASRCAVSLRRRLTKRDLIAAGWFTTPTAKQEDHCLARQSGLWSRDAADFER